MKRYASRWLVTVGLFLSASCLHGATVLWINTNGGNWSVSANWNPGYPPHTGDTAIITNRGNYTVTLDTNTSLGGFVLGATNGTTQTLLINGQTFSLAGYATVNSGGQIDLSSGAFNGETNGGGGIFSGALSPTGGNLSGEWTFTTNSVLTLESTNVLTGLVLLTNYGTVVWSNVDLTVQSAARIENYGLWDDETNDTFYGASDGTVFNNHGTFRKSGGIFGNGETYLDNNTTFNNPGLVDLQTGALFMSSGSDSGTVNTASNAVMLAQIGAFIGNPSFSGPGFLEGFWTGSNAVVNGTLTFEYGSLSGTVTVASNAVVNFTPYPGVSTLDFGALVLTNYGTVVWSNVDLTAEAAARIDNYGLWDDETNDTFYGGSGGTVFNNHGTFRKSGGIFGNGETYLDNNTTFNNPGLVDVQTGGLFIYSVSDSGTVNTASNGVMLAQTGALVGNPSFSGPGSFQGTWIGSNAVVNGALTFEYGTLVRHGNRGQQRGGQFHALERKHRGGIRRPGADQLWDGGLEQYEFSRPVHGGH